MKRILLAALLGFSHFTYAQWSGQSNVNTPVAVANDIQYTANAVSDGNGGVIVAWTDWRNGNADVYIQRLNAAGVPQWTANGIAVTNIPGNQSFPILSADGAGGVFMVWTDNTSGTNDIYAQRINASGTLLWTASGKPVCTAANDQHAGELKPFGTDGMLIAWNDYRLSTQPDIYAQYLDGSGNPQWVANGILICNA